MNLAQKLRAQLGATQPLDHFRTDHGITDTHIFCKFGKPIDNLTMTLEQCDEMIAAMQFCRAKFIERQEEKKNV